MWDLRNAVVLPCLCRARARSCASTGVVAEEYATGGCDLQGEFPKRTDLDGRVLVSLQVRRPRACLAPLIQAAEIA
ncbi:hypothetical protein BD413DRAFT_205249 [Trametes elegans]|nr:hypothetical protein BD413DRAFT_205249 [Trametes elegans]